jgi:hypothetical protein
MAKERSPAKARAALDTVFAAARLDLAALAQKHVFNASNPLGSLKDVLSPLSPNALLQTPLAEHILNFTMMEGTALASLLPDRLRSTGTAAAGHAGLLWSLGCSTGTGR